MDDTVYKIALAGFLHDIGKFAERAEMNVSQDFLNNNAGLYQPYNPKQQRHTHKHAVYTAAFIDHIEKLLPETLNKAVWGLGDTFINLAAGHHNPQTSLQWVIAMADRVSSGFDRQEFENYNNETDNKGVAFSDYKKTRLLTLFEGLSVNDKWKDDKLEFYVYRYPLKELSPQNIFPVKWDNVAQVDKEAATKEYYELFLGFVDALEHLEHKQNIPLWFEHFDSLFLIYTSHIPAAPVGTVVPDVSLYDHSKITAAMAASIYKYHQENGSLDVDHIKEYHDKKFLLINGDFYGIQNFVFSESGATGKASAKLLRGRSFSVSLITELAADMLCREIGIPSSSIILNAAGKFTIMAPNTESARAKVIEVENNINDWLIKHFYGQSSLGISCIEATCDNFVSNKFPELWDRLHNSMEKKKFTKFDLLGFGGPVESYLDSFLGQPLCQLCGKRPSHKDAYVEVSNKRICSCRICHDHIYIGEHLVKEERVAITTHDADLRGDKLLEPVFGRYQLSFDVSGKLGDMARTGNLLKYWDIGIRKNGIISKDITARFINGYVPKYADEDSSEEMVERLLHGKKSKEKQDELFDMIKTKTPKTFYHIAKMALNKIEYENSKDYLNKKTKFKGVEALGVLKADVDNLGLIFSYGIREERQTLSRLATLSRQMNNFFAVYLPYLLSTDNRFKDTYTVFAGGDDLFLIGPWNRIIEFSALLKEKFEEYTCRNLEITLSAGISINKPDEPVLSLADNAEGALHESKSKEKKNSLTAFRETVTWDEFVQLIEIKDTIERWFDDGTVNNAMLFRLNELIEMVKQEKEIKKAEYGIHMEDMECLKWRARLKYSVVRNIGKKLKNEQKEQVIEEVLTTMKWLDDYAGGMKIPLWQILYNNR